MQKIFRHEHGFSSIEIVLVIVIVAVIGGVGYYVHTSSKKSADTLSSANQNASNSPKFTNRKAAAGSTTSTSNSSLQSALSSASSSVSQSNQAQSSANNAVNDKSTFTNVNQ